MFSGIVEAVGIVTRMERRGEGAKIQVDAGPLAGGVERGDSICLSGVCLTAVEIRPPHLAFEVNRETLQRTTLGALDSGRKLNLERALRVGDRIGGHFVQGHVDGMGTVLDLDRRPGATLLKVGWDSDALLLLVEKGSVAVDGVSLTVVDVYEEAFTVTLIPETLASTTLAALSPGTPVNVEADILGKTIVRFLQRKGKRGPAPGSTGPLSLDDLSEAGFL
jgi:riboflavin synthase